MTEESISPRMRKMLEKGRKAARAKVIERGIIQFRADAKLMTELLELSEKQKIPLGTMVRNWVAERLESESIEASSKNTIAVADKITAAVLSNFRQAQIVVLNPAAQFTLTHVASADFYRGLETNKQRLEYFASEFEKTRYQ